MYPTHTKPTTILSQWFTLVAVAMLVLTAATAASPVAVRRSFVQAATGSEYRQETPTSKWQHQDSAEITLGSQFNTWLASDLTVLVRTDVATGLALDNRLRLLRLGPLNVQLRTWGALGMGLQGDIWMYRGLAAGPELGLNLGRRTLSVWGIAGLQERSVWHYNRMDKPFAEAGAALRPTSGSNGFTVEAGSRFTENPFDAKQISNTWTGSLGYRWAI